MDKKLEYLWLSPTGEVIECNHEVIEAREILKKRYKVDGPYHDPVKILLNYGWMAYRHDPDLGQGWMIHENRRPIRKFQQYGTIPTQAQQDKIFELFGRKFDDSWVTWNASGFWKNELNWLIRFVGLFFL